MAEPTTVQCALALLVSRISHRDRRRAFRRRKGLSIRGQPLREQRSAQGGGSAHEE